MKKIYLTETEQAALVKEFTDKIASARLSDGKVSFTYSFEEKTEQKDKVKLCFTAKAWLKIQTLVNGFSTEVGWHGTCERVPGGYLVTDVIVYPQTVTGATVNTDQDEYGNWKIALTDEQDANLRFHGHSHVSMGVSPSAVDTDHRNQILATLPKDGFYVFIIVNKSGDMSVRIFDMQENRIYDKEDVEPMVLIDDNTSAASFLETAKELVKNKTYAAADDKKPAAKTKKQPSAEEKKFTLLDGTPMEYPTQKKKSGKQDRPYRWNTKTQQYEYMSKEDPRTVYPYSCYEDGFYDDGSYQWGCSQR